ncbi:MAG: PAS domain S-box protein [Rhodospirillales bacterium]|nr:PAS domain S-box protein [Rhodospirillales bacterium]
MSFFDDMTDVYYRTDSSGKILFVSKSVERLLGYTAKEAIGQELANYYAHPDGREKFLAALQTSGGQISGYHGELRHKDGSSVWVSTSSKFVFDEAGELAGIEGIARNISDEIQLLDDRYRQLFTNAGNQADKCSSRFGYD